MKKMTNHVLFSEGYAHMKTPPLFLAQVLAESMIGQGDFSKCVKIVKVFKDAYKSTLYYYP
ncbi:hypothetical protein HanPI659440_Chr07g0274771 [Helianthus annuus]|nr:hypothetical protein HanPI659440_Chr07g0274771 [Helianthus annuus]